MISKQEADNILSLYYVSKNIASQRVLFCCERVIKCIFKKPFSLHPDETYGFALYNNITGSARPIPPEHLQEFVNAVSMLLDCLAPASGQKSIRKNSDRLATYGITPDDLQAIYNRK